MESQNTQINEQKVRELVTLRITEVEEVVSNLQGLRNSLLTHAYQAKQRVLEAMSDHRNALQLREMTLLNQVDDLLKSKDNAMIIQLSKLHQVLGCLKNCLDSDHPCGECLEKLEDIDFEPISEISMEFTNVDQLLCEAINKFGQISLNQETLPKATYNTTDLTSWLLTPTNQKQCDVTQPDCTDKTEWLVQNLSATHSVPSTDETFLQVSSTDTGKWLHTGASLDPGSQPHSLCSLVSNPTFNDVAQQKTTEWLETERCEIESAVSSVAPMNVETSSVHSLSSGMSFVLLNTELKGSESDRTLVQRIENDMWLQKPEIGKKMDSAIHQWVANTHEENWLSSSRRSSVSSVPAVSRPNSEWLVSSKRAMKKIMYDSWLSPETASQVELKGLKMLDDFYSEKRDAQKYSGSEFGDDDLNSVVSGFYQENPQSWYLPQPLQSASAFYNTPSVTTGADSWLIK